MPVSLIDPLRSMRRIAERSTEEADSAFAGNFRPSAVSTSEPVSTTAGVFPNGWTVRTPLRAPSAFRVSELSEASPSAA